MTNLKIKKEDKIFHDLNNLSLRLSCILDEIQEKRVINSKTNSDFEITINSMNSAWKDLLRCNDL